MSRQANGGKLVALNLVLLWILLLAVLLLRWGIIRTLRRHDERFAQLDFSPPADTGTVEALHFAVEELPTAG